MDNKLPVDAMAENATLHECFIELQAASVDVLRHSIEKSDRITKLEFAARFAYDAILSSSVCDEPCGCIDCQMLETLGEALNIPRIGET